MKHFPNIWLNKETVGADFLIGVDKGVQANNGSSVVRQLFQIFLNKATSCFSCHIEVDLFAHQRYTKLFLTTISKLGNAIGSTWLPFVNQVYIFLSRPTVWPKVFVVDKQIRIGRLIFLSRKSREKATWLRLRPTSSLSDFSRTV